MANNISNIPNMSMVPKGATPAQNALNKNNPAKKGIGSFFKNAAYYGSGFTNPVISPVAKYVANLGKKPTNEPNMSVAPKDTTTNIDGTNTQNRNTTTGTGTGTSFNTGTGNNGLISQMNQNNTPTQPAVGTPAYYAAQQEQYNKNISDLGAEYSGRIAAPFAQTGIGEAPKRLSDYELARGNYLVGTQEKARAGNEPLLTASQPKTIGPTDYAYNPLEGAQSANQGAGSAASRVFNAGALGAIQGQGGQSVQLQQAQNTISNLTNLLGDNNATQINRLNQFVNDIKGNISNPELAQFKTTLGALANAVSSVNPTLAQQLTQYSGGNLGDANAQTIMAAIGAAQNAIQGQQQAIGGNVQSSSGNTGNVVNTSVGQINTNW